MQKIPTVYLRGRQNMARVTDDVNPACQWVSDGEGVPTRKWDGTCILIEQDPDWSAPRSTETRRVRASTSWWNTPAPRHSPIRQLHCRRRKWSPSPPTGVGKGWSGITRMGGWADGEAEGSGLPARHIVLTLAPGARGAERRGDTFPPLPQRSPVGSGFQLGSFTATTRTRTERAPARRRPR